MVYHLTIHYSLFTVSPTHGADLLKISSPLSDCSSATKPRSGPFQWLYCMLLLEISLVSFPFNPGRDNHRKQWIVTFLEQKHTTNHGCHITLTLENWSDLAPAHVLMSCDMMMLCSTSKNSSLASMQPSCISQCCTKRH